MDNHVRIAELQQKIREGIEIEESNILFEFKENGETVIVDVITINAKHMQSFLFHTAEGRDKIEALESMLNYVNQAKTQYNSYTLQWSLISEDDLHTSYFRAKNIMDAFNAHVDIESVQAIDSVTDES